MGKGKGRSVRTPLPLPVRPPVPVMPPPPSPPPAPSPPPFMRSAACAAFFKEHVKAPHMANRKERFHLALASAAARPNPRPRRVWDAIVFGFELPMLRLHMDTLFSSVAGFLVIEADGCFQTKQDKRPVLSDAIANKTAPLFMVTKTHVRIVTRREALAYFASGHDQVCRKERRPASGYSGRCFQVGWVGSRAIGGLAAERLALKCEPWALALMASLMVWRTDRRVDGM